MINFTHHLTPAERVELGEINRRLTALTDAHCHTCECELCQARTLTDVQEEAAFHLPYTPAENGQN